MLLVASELERRGFVLLELLDVDGDAAAGVVPLVVRINAGDVVAFCELLGVEPPPALRSLAREIPRPPELYEPPASNDVIADVRRRK